MSTVVPDQKVEYFLAFHSNPNEEKHVGKKVALRTTPTPSSSMAASILGEGSQHYYFEIEGVPGTFDTYYAWQFWRDTPDARAEWEKHKELTKRAEKLRGKAKAIRKRHALGT